MALDDDHDDERPRSEPPAPDDRLWRHPSEVAGGTPLPTAWLRPPPRTGPRRSMAVAALVSAGLAGAAVAMGIMWITRPTKVVVKEAEAPTVRAATTAVFTPAAIPSEDLAKEIGPSLVRVEVSRDGAWTAGSGIWLDDQGTVAVSAPLIAGGDELLVTDISGERVPAEITAADFATGIAVLQADDLTGSTPPAVATEVDPGLTVVIVGAATRSPGGDQEQRVLPASVSAVGVRATVDQLVLHDAVQLDRAVPADAIGGVVLDADGNLVGIVLTASGPESLAVVVRADEALAVARQLRDDGEVRRAWLGVRTVDLTPEAAQLLDVRGGALLTDVEAGSPAAAAGLAPGDVITDVDGYAIDGASDLVVSLRDWLPGEQVEVTWHRGTDSGTTEVTLGG